jgi:hypothetical protein
MPAGMTAAMATTCQPLLQRRWWHWVPLLLLLLPLPLWILLLVLLLLVAPLLPVAAASS